MTEAEWLASVDYQEMLQHLLEIKRLTDRKRRLFVCGCCRLVWHCLIDKRGREAVEVAEQVADSDNPYAHWKTVLQGPRKGTQSARYNLGLREETRAEWMVYRIAELAAADHLWGVVPELDQLTQQFGEEWPSNEGELVRDLYGNPFLQLCLESSWFHWNGGAIARLAESIYTDRAFDRLPILADALEEAGCTNADILSHCRGPGPHVRGCWVVDLILSKDR